MWEYGGQNFLEGGIDKGCDHRPPASAGESCGLCETDKSREGSWEKWKLQFEAVLHVILVSPHHRHWLSASGLQIQMEHLYVSEMQSSLYPFILETVKILYFVDF